MNREYEMRQSSNSSEVEYDEVRYYIHLLCYLEAFPCVCTHDGTKLYVEDVAQKRVHAPPNTTPLSIPLDPKTACV